MALEPEIFDGFRLLRREHPEFLLTCSLRESPAPLREESMQEVDRRVRHVPEKPLDPLGEAIEALEIGDLAGKVMLDGLFDPLEQELGVSGRVEVTIERSTRSSPGRSPSIWKDDRLSLRRRKTAALDTTSGCVKSASSTERSTPSRFKANSRWAPRSSNEPPY